MKSDNYWANRANQRMDDYILQSEKTANEIAKAYYQAAKNIESDMAKVVKGLGAISSDESALRNLKFPPNKTALASIRAAVNSMPEGQAKQEALTALASPAYQFRMRRLQATIDNARKECERLYKAELKDTTAHLKNLYSDAFNHTMYDIDKGYNTLHTYSQFPESRVTKLLKSQWSGANYSSRIWNSTSDLAASLKEQMLIAYMTGASVSEVSRAIMNEFQSSAYAARRLVRTETNFVANQAELDAYRRLGIEEYKYIATLDTRTSTICQSLDGRVFNVEDGKAGVNLPPMHPNCRSTTIMYDADSQIKERAARDENGKRITVPGDMTYKEWQEKYHPELVDKSSGSGIIKEREVEYGVPYGDYSVTADMEFINSDGYARIFNNISENSILNNTLLECSRSSISHRNGTKFEDIYFIHAETGEILAKQLESTYESCIYYNDEITSLLKRAKKENIPLVTIHNHPEGYPPSVDDLNKSFENNTLFGLAVGHNGQVYKYNNPGMLTDDADEIHEVISIRCETGTDIDRAYKEEFELRGLYYEIVKGE